MCVIHREASAQTHLFPGPVVTGGFPDSRAGVGLAPRHSVASPATWGWCRAHGGCTCLPHICLPGRRQAVDAQHPEQGEGSRAHTSGTNLKEEPKRQSPQHILF